MHVRTYIRPFHRSHTYIHICMCNTVYVCTVYMRTVSTSTNMYVQTCFNNTVLLFPFSKLRAKLGLKPLQVDDGANKENGTTSYIRSIHSYF